MAGRTIAIGDIHGCSVALARLIDAMHLKPEDTIVSLGDYVNRGPDSRGVLDLLIELGKHCRLIPLLGNHDQMLLHNRAQFTEVSGPNIDDFGSDRERFGERHFEFLKSCRRYYENETHFFVHANYDSTVALEDQETYMLMWMHLDPRRPKRHRSGKLAVVGHTAQKSGEILDRGHLICIDTHCHAGGWLTALDTVGGRVWQVDRWGRVRVR